MVEDTTPLYQTCVNIEINNVLASRSVAEKNATEVVTVEFAVSITSPFDANSGAKQFKRCKVWFDSIISFKRCCLHFQVNQPIM